MKQPHSSSSEPLTTVPPRAEAPPIDSAQLQKPISGVRSGAYRIACLGLLLICLFLFFWRLGNIPLFDLDEGVYVAAARQMAISGDIVTPRLNSRPADRPEETTVPFFEKPILIYWLSAGSMRLLGLSEWAARLPAALASLLATWAVAWAGTRWFGRRAGLLAGLVYATAPMTVLDARQMTTDSLLVLWFTVALLAFWNCRNAARPQASWLYAMLFWAMCALAVLTKGAVGLLLPLLVIGVFLALDRLAVRLRRSRRRGLVGLFQLRLHRPAEWWPHLRKLRPLGGLLLFLALAVPWHYFAWRVGGRDAQGHTFLQEYIVRQHIGRFRGGDAVHNMPLPTYFLYFLIGFFPWACFAPAAFRFGRKKRAGRADTEAGPWDGAAQEADAAVPALPEAAAHARTVEGSEEQEVYRFLLVWFWTIFVFFSLSAAKLPTYIVPAYPAAALLTGRWLGRLWVAARGAERDARALRRGALAAVVTAGLLLAALVLMTHLGKAARVPIPVAQTAQGLALVLFVGCVLAWGCFVRGERAPVWRQRGVGALALTMIALIGIGCTQGYAVAERYLLGPYQRLAAMARTDAQAGKLIVYYNIIPRRPSMLYYAEYSPLERKETPLLPFLRRYLTPARPEADVITPRSTFLRELQAELDSAPDLSVRRLAETGDPAGGWVLLRLTLHPAPPTT